MLFYDEMAEEFDQAIHDAVQHPIIVIISSCQAQFFRGSFHLVKFMSSNIFTELNYYIL